MKKGLTEIVTIIDKSGSMSSLQSRTIEGYNEFLNEQKQLDGDANFSLVLFSSPGKEEIVFDSVDIQEISELTTENYRPGGATALYDCIGKTIKALKKRIKNLDKDERPEKVLFVIITDGEENSSRTFGKDEVFKMINKREEKNDWSFIYLGANQDAFGEGSKMGVKRGKTLDYAATDAGMNFAYANISNYTSSFRKSRSVKASKDINFENAEKDSKIGNTD